MLGTLWQRLLRPGAVHAGRQRVSQRSLRVAFDGLRVQCQHGNVGFSPLSTGPWSCGTSSFIRCRMSALVHKRHGILQMLMSIIICQQLVRACFACVYTYMMIYR